VQTKYEKERTNRDIILKARQEGFSSYIIADMLIDCIRGANNSMVLSHETEATKRLFAKNKYYIENLEVKPAIKYETASSLSFEKTNSNYYIGTAGQKAVGRGDTLRRLHLSECAFFDKAEKIMAGVTSSVPIDGKIVIESTPNGRGNWFYNEWQKAKNGQSIYKPHLYPWFLLNEYKFTKDEILSLKLSSQIQNDILREEMSDKEKSLNISMGQIRWRRYTIWDKDDLFFQEFIEDDISCFLQSGRPVFKTVNMTDRPALSTDKEYIGGVDGAEGVSGGDNHCFALLETSNPMKVAYEITSNEPIDVFCKQVADICKKYKVRLGVEKNGVGVAHCQKLEDLDIEFSKWNTSSTSRPLMITELEEAYRKGELLETYPEAQNELMDMQYDDKNKPVHLDNKHDDRVFARAIAFQQRKQQEVNFRFI